MTTQTQSIPPQIASSTASLQRAMQFHGLLNLALGLTLVAGSGEIHQALGIPSAWMVVDFGLLTLAVAGWLYYRSWQPGISPTLIKWLGFLHVDAAIVLWIVALSGWLTLEPGAKVGLALLGDLSLVVGAYQVYAWRKSDQVG